MVGCDANSRMGTHGGGMGRQVADEQWITQMRGVSCENEASDAQPLRTPLVDLVRTYVCDLVFTGLWIPR